jgi:hypothetical protein
MPILDILSAAGLVLLPAVFVCAVIWFSWEPDA